MRGDVIWIRYGAIRYDPRSGAVRACVLLQVQFSSAHGGRPLPARGSVQQPRPKGTARRALAGVIGG
ncbi:hypothetical protein BHE90_014146 [Fusarium euwallaceae]|uniref:Uncharacterized protein n=1 Tax=Fusarium euwallaceae TaxID=1147111 RepID=A0A430L6W8_9HYPO|nr:hypothetical protein BHE90_014146 [Fusarium euwallaceae]